MPIKIETGRFVTLALEGRVCEVCNLNEIEDELHFICNVNYILKSEMNFMTMYLSVNPNFPVLSFQDKFTFLMVNEQLKTSRLLFQSYKLGKICYTIIRFSLFHIMFSIVYIICLS